MSDDTQPSGTQPFGTRPSPPQRPTANPAPPAPPLRPSEHLASIRETASIAPAAPLAPPPTHQAAPAPVPNHPAQALVDAPTLLDGGNDAIVTTTTVTRGRGLRFGLVAAVAAVSVAGAVAVNTALSAPAGPQTPEDAVDQMLAALENEDVLGMTDVMLPSEREAFIEPSLAVLDEIQRLGFLDDVDLDGEPAEAGTEGGLIPGLDLDFEGVEYVVTPIGDGVANVSVVAGTATATVDPSQLPDSFEDPYLSESPFTETEDLSDEDISMTIVEEDGGWYVSLWYSAAEQARRDAGAAVPIFGQGPAAIGGATPGEAVSGLIAEMVELDLDGSIGHLDPREFRALYDYSPLFVPDAQTEIDQFRVDLAQEDITWSVTDVVTSSQEIRGRTVVTVEGLSGSVSTPDGTFLLVSDGDCQTVSGPGIETQTACATDPGASFAELSDLALFQKLSEVETGITVVERDGRWFVSGAPTVLYGAVDVLSVLERSDIDQVVDEGDQLAEEFFDAFFGGNLFGDPFMGDDFTLDQEPGLDQFAEDSASEDFDAVLEALENGARLDENGEVTNDFVSREDLGGGIALSEPDPALFIDGVDAARQDPDTSRLNDLTDNPPRILSSYFVFDNDGFIEMAEFDSPETAAYVFAALEGFEPTDSSTELGWSDAYSADEMAVLADRWILIGEVHAPSGLLAYKQADHLIGR